MASSEMAFTGLERASARVLAILRPQIGLSRPRWDPYHASLKVAFRETCYLELVEYDAREHAQVTEALEELERVESCRTTD